MLHTDAADFSAALDPSRSAVVEACAGSGKTWLLASRIVRLLLAGAAPGEILAITFTRKAAREIEERVVDWLRDLATADAAAVSHFLRERGAVADAVTLATARGLYERVTGAQPGLAVNTFHGWFLQLVAVAPLSANLAGTTLADEGSRRFEELWQRFARRMQRLPGSEVAQSFVRLLGGIGLASTRTLLRQGMARRAEWLAMGGDEAAVLQEIRQRFAVVHEGEALSAFFEAGWEADVQAYLGFLEASDLATDQAFAERLAAVFVEPDPEARLALLASVLLTEKGGLRSRKPSKTLDQRFGAEPAQRFLLLHARLGERVQQCQARLQEERNFSFNRDALCVYAAFLSHLEEFKAERRQIDFVDAEWRVLQLLRDDSSAAFVQARLDARYRHVLLDEFQDTNPLQWQILLAWLEAYTDAVRPSVFLVGDPKQSIYRFRRAEPRLFATAAAFLASRFAAVRLAQDDTRRNAPPIVDVVNALFSHEPAFQPFRPQGSLATGLPGRVELLPLFDGGAVTSDKATSAVGAGLRDPLREPAEEIIDQRKRDEAAAMASCLEGMLGRMLVRDGEGERPLRCGDVMLLVRKRTDIATYEQALAARGIPFMAASRGGLLSALEVRDVVALLEFLVTPAADLPLAHALKSPLFACCDDDLLLLSARTETSWLARLMAIAALGTASPALMRAARLVSAWLPVVPTLPAHDLLDRIYDEGEVMARYRVAVPKARCAAAQANLEALLLLSLDLDRGRYPSLPRFIDELRVLRRAESDDAPDEGELAVNDNVIVDGRVRILTIHGAKGLEAPLVWLLDANAAAPADRAWDVVVDWPPDVDRPLHFSFVGRKEERGLSRQLLFEADAAAAEREELNLLYVAMTRARQVFVASGTAAGRGDAEKTAFGRLEAALQRLGAADGRIYGDTLPSVPASGKVSGGNVPAALPLAVADVPAVGERRMATDAAARFGILLHALLERQTEGRDAASDAGWWRDMGYDDAEMRQVRPVAARLLMMPHLQPFFDARRYLRAWNELEIADADAAVCRIDRLVELDDAFWVLDYKSSSADTERFSDYQVQVAGYCRALAPVFPLKPIRGGLIFSDGTFVEVIL